MKKKAARRNRQTPERSVSAAAGDRRPSNQTPRVKVFVSPEPRPPAAAPPRHKVNVWVAGGRLPERSPQDAPSEPDLPLLEPWEAEFLAREFLADAADASPGSVRLLVSPPPPKQRRWLGTLLATVLWLGSGSLVTMAGCTAFWMIVNPGRVNWLSWTLPEWNREAFIRDDTPRSWSTIQTEAVQQNLTLGAPLLTAAPGKSAGKTSLVLLPVLAPQPRCNATAACLQLVELRAYHLETALEKGERLSSETRLQLGDRLQVSGPPEYGVVSLLAGGTPAGQGSTRRLPLHQIQPIEGTAPRLGGWFLLSGEQRRGNQAIAYGHIGYYDAAQRRIRLLLPWTSLAQRPRWQAVTGDDAPELVLDQTIGLEPRFTVYQIKPPESGGLLRLEPIALAQPPFPSQSLENALFLARSGLWSAARAWLEGYKTRNPNTWNAAAQAQLDVVAMHAAATRAQADRDRASPSQRFATQIIDGRWAAAIALLQSTLQDGSDVQTLLGGDANRWRQRAEAMLRVDANHTDAQLIGGLIVMQRQGRDEAITWLQQQNRAPVPQTPTAPLHPRTQSVLRQLDRLPLSNAIAHPSRLLGTAVPLPNPRPADWDTPDGAVLPTLPPGQTWYRVVLTRFHDGNAWQRAPFTQQAARMTPSFLWHQLGLGDRATVQRVTWDQQPQMQSQSLTIRALRLHNDAIQLLASGEPPAAAPGTAPSNQPHLILSDAALTWQPPTESTSLAALQMQQPEQGNAILRAIAAELRRARPNLPLPPSDDPDALIQAFGPWPVQLADLTGDRQPEVLLALHPDLLDPSPEPSSNPTPDPTAPPASPNPPAATATAPPRTLIFAANGSLIYSELAAAAGQLVAIARLEDDQPPVIVVNQRDRPVIQRWVAPRQRFEAID